MKEKSAIEILEEFANKHNYPFHSSIKQNKHRLNHMGKMLSSKYVSLDLSSLGENLYMVFYDSHGVMKAFCGLYKKISKCDSEVSIIKRDWIDALSFKKRYKTGDSLIDKKVTIQTERKDQSYAFINGKNINAFLQLNKYVKPLKLCTERNTISVVDALHEQHVVYLHCNRWILEENELQTLINKGSDLLNRIK
jgi:hypothetical protein